MALTNRYISSAGVGTYAGSTSSASPMSLATAITNAAAGDVMNIKQDGSYTQGGNISFANNGSATSPILWRGYKTTIGDGFLGFNSDGSLVTTNMPVINGSSWRLSLGGTHNVVESCNIQANAGGAALNLSGGQSSGRFNRVANADTTANGHGIDCNSAGNNAALFNDVFITSTTSAAFGIRGNSSLAKIIGNRVSGGYHGLSHESGFAVFAFNISFSAVANAGRVIGTGNSSAWFHNTLTKCGGNCIDIVSGSTVACTLIGNMLTDSTGYGIEGNAAGTSLIAMYNGFGRNLATTHNADDWISAMAIGNVTLTASAGGDYQDYANNDFRLVTGSLAKGAGIRGSLDLGAMQRVEAAAGGGGRIIGSSIIQAVQ